MHEIPWHIVVICSLLYVLRFPNKSLRTQIYDNPCHRISIAVVKSTWGQPNMPFFPFCICKCRGTTELYAVIITRGTLLSFTYFSSYRITISLLWFWTSHHSELPGSNAWIRHDPRGTHANLLWCSREVHMCSSHSGLWSQSPSEAGRLGKSTYVKRLVCY